MKFLKNGYFNKIFIIRINVLKIYIFYFKKLCIKLGIKIVFNRNRSVLILNVYGFKF